MCRTRFTEISERTKEIWGRLEEAYTFDARAAEILDLFEHNPVSKNQRKKASLSEDINQLIDSIKPHHDKISQMLHVQPTAVLVDSLSYVEKFQFTHVGLGLGPWEVDMDVNASQLASSMYDGVLFDEEPLNSEYSQMELRHFIRGICRSLKPFGKITVVHKVSNQETTTFWSDFLSSNGLRHEHSTSKSGWQLDIFNLPLDIFCLPEESHDK